MKSVACVTLSIFLLIFSSHETAFAQSAEEEELKQVLEMMKAQGADPQQVQQMENMFRNMSQMEAQKKNTQIAKEQQEFDTATDGYGTAVVEVDGKRYDLKVTKCEVKDSKGGVFTLLARQAPGVDSGELSIHSDGVDRRQSINFSVNSRPPVNYNTTGAGLQLDGKDLSWQGLVESNNRKQSLALSLSCGVEAVFYDTASRARPDKSANIMTLYLGPEAYDFQAGRCSTEPYRTGNLEVVFEASATGSFRGRPAIVLLSSSRGVAGTESEGAGQFHTLDLLLGEISPAQARLSPLELKKQLSETVVSYRAQQMAAHQKKYNEEQLSNSSPSEMSAAMDAYSADMDAINAKADGMRFPSANSNQGVITINGQDILYRGPALNTRDAKRAQQFQNLSALPEVFVRCGTN